MRKIAAITGTRAEYGLSKTILEAIAHHPELELAIIVTGMHLMETFGSSYKLIAADGFKIDYFTGVTQEEDTTAAMARALGRNILAVTDALEQLKPDIMLVLTDLGHTLAGAIAAAHMNIPVAHVHGGDVSGNIDEMIRHATTKFSHLHFPGSEVSAQRLAKLGEDPWRIHMFGAPGGDEILRSVPLSRQEIDERFELEEQKPFLLLVQHPGTLPEDVRSDIRETISAIRKLAFDTIVIYPNADAGGRIIIEEYGRLATEPFVRIYQNLPRREYLSLMRNAACMVGNSSSGIIEAPFFNLPVVNIGNRQNNRQRAGNVIDVPPRADRIVDAVRKAITPSFKESLSKQENPYGKGGVGEQIARVLAEVEINDRLRNKVLPY